MPPPGERQHPLQYAPHQSRRRWRRALVAAVMLVVLLAAALHWGPPLARQAKLLYWQRQCLRYTAPPDRVVVEEATGGVAVYW